MRKVACGVLLFALCLGGVVHGAEKSTAAELRQLKQTAAEQSKQIEELRGQIAALKNPTSMPATQPAATRPAVTPGTLEQRTLAMNKAMDRVVKEFVFDKITLGELPAKLKAQFGLDVEMDSHALAEAKIADDIVVSANLRQVTLGKALNTLLATAGTSMPLDYEVTEGFVRITTLNKIATVTRIQVYDIRDLIAKESKEPSSGGNLMVRSRMEIVKTVIQKMQSAVMPASWRDNGGTIGSVRETSGLLYIQHSSKGHELIAEYFKKCRGR